MAGGEFSDNTIDAASESEKDVLINQATVFDNINYMGRAVIGELLQVCYNGCYAQISSYTILTQELWQHVRSSHITYT